MAILIASIPNIFSADQKQAYIANIKEAFHTAFGTAKSEIKLFILNYKPEDCCASFADKMHLNVYMPFGNTEDDREVFAREYRAACEKTFGDKFRPAFSTIDEHTPDDEYRNGALLSRAR